MLFIQLYTLYLICYHRIQRTWRDEGGDTPTQRGGLHDSGAEKRERRAKSL
jgi:hypothetical protein